MKDTKKCTLFGAGLMLRCGYASISAMYFERRIRMNDDKILIEALRRLSVQTGSIACLGCKYEYDCGIYGCAIICAARERLEELTASPWISVNDRLPEDEQGVLVIASGRPREHLELDSAHELATFYAGEGWSFDAYPEWEDPQVTYWMPLPERPEEV
jgi:hypothetical protein